MQVFLNPAEQLKKGLELLADTVGATLGPAGQHVLLEQKIDAPPILTKDGVTVARFVDAQDALMRSAIKTVITAAREMNAEIGDGTTSAVLLTCKLTSLILDVDRTKRRDVIKYLEKFFDEAIALIKSQSTPIAADKEDLLPIASLACNNDTELGEIVAKVVAEVGSDGVVTHQSSKTGEHSTEVSMGLHFPRGYLSPYFITDRQKETVDMEDCLIFITDERMYEAQQIVPMLEYLGRNQGKSLLIVAQDITDEALATLIMNRVHRNMPVCAIKAPKFGSRRIEALEDLALCTDGKVFSEEMGIEMKSMAPQHFVEILGRSERVIISRDRTIVVGGAGNPEIVAGRANDLREETKLAGGQEQTHLQERLARLVGGVGVIHVGGRNDTEMTANLFLVEDGIQACFSALKSGVIPAGGNAYRWAAKLIEKKTPENSVEEDAIKVFGEAVREPLIRLIANGIEGGVPGPATYMTLSNWWGENDSFGYNVITEEISDFTKLSLIEPTALSVAALRIGLGCSATLGRTLAAVVADDAE